MVKRGTSTTTLLLSCEHGGNRVPREHRLLFADAGELLKTHRGWDIGALDLAEHLQAQTGAPLFAAETTRLLVDLNRSAHSRALFSEFTKPLPRDDRQAIQSEHWNPHRAVVEDAVAGLLAGGQRVIHVAVHSFTPVFNGVTRATDFGMLYDPRRHHDRAFSLAWQAALQRARREYTVHCNAPYKGVSDSLPTALRERFDGESYVGMELELNHKFALESAPAWKTTKQLLLETLREALESV